MSKSAAIRAGQAYVEVFLDSSKMQSGLMRAQQRLRQFGADLKQMGMAMGLAGGAMLAPAIWAVREFQAAAKRGELAAKDLTNAMRLAGSMQDVQDKARQLGVSIGGALAPAVAKLADKLSAVLVKLREFSDANPTAARALMALSGTAVGVGATLAAIGLGAQLIGGGLRTLVPLLKVATVGINVFHKAFVAARMAVATGLLAVKLGGISAIGSSLLGLLNPMTLVAAGAAAVGYAIMTNTESGRAYLGQLGKGFSELSEDVSNTATGIVDALSSGDFGDAAAIAWQGIKTAFVRGYQAVEEVMAAFSAGIMKGFVYLGEWIAKGWASTVGFIAQSMAKIRGWVSEAQGGAAVIVSAALEAAGAVDEGTTDQAIAAAAEAFTEGEQQINAEMKAIEAETKQKYESITQGAADMRQVITDELGNLLTANEKQLQDMRSKLKDMASRAAGPGAGPIATPGYDGADYMKDAAGLGDSERERFDIIEELSKRRDRLAEQIANVRPPRSDVFGTFSSAATFGIGIGQTAQDRTAENTSKMVKELQELNGQIGGLEGATFSP